VRPTATTLAWAVVSSATLLGAAACDKPKAPEPDRPAASATTPSTNGAPVKLSERMSRPVPERLVAIGDIHGDLESAKRVLKLAGAIDDQGAWVGGKLVVVQVGDEIDRGDDDRKVVDLFERLTPEAKKAGGDVVAMDGNHELMNAQFDFRYVTPGGYAEFGDVAPKNGDVAARVASLDERARGRAAAFAPGGDYAKMFAERPIALEVGDTVFVHGGLLSKHVAYGLDKMNDEVHAWLLGKEPAPPPIVVAEDGPVWTRFYSAAPGPAECAELEKTLGMLGVKRMVVAHTVQRGGISSACNDKVWRIDVGLSRYYGGPIQALEIKGDSFTVLKEGG
jgi:hypothetical protein